MHLEMDLTHPLRRRVGRPHLTPCSLLFVGISWRIHNFAIMPSASNGWLQINFSSFPLTTPLFIGSRFNYRLLHLSFRVDHHHHHYLFLNCEDRWGTKDDFATNFLHLFLFSTALWDLPNSRPVHSLMLSSHLFLCLPRLLPPFLTRWFWPDLMNGKHDHTTAVCVSLRSSGDLRVVQSPVGSWHGLARW